MSKRVDYLMPFKLLKEARESWDYFLTNELVYAIQDRDVIGRRRYTWCLKAYLKGNIWIELCIRNRTAIGGSYHNLWLIEYSSYVNPYFATTRDTYFGNALRLDEKSMLSFIGQFSENREQMDIRPIPSVIWLHPFNLVDSGGQYTFDLSHRVFPIKFNCVPDGESCPLTASPINNSQLPSNKIEGCSQVYGEIGQNDTPRIRSRGRPSNNNLPFTLFFFNSSEGSRVFLEFSNTAFERAEMFIRPITLEPSMIQWMGGYNHERKTSKDTKDSKGTRNPHTNTRRIRTKSKKGNKSQQITPSQPEEVTSQTSPAHHHGGYNAKNTHLGSPEDV
jgi:hypothetical protein